MRRSEKEANRMLLRLYGIKRESAFYRKRLAAGEDEARTLIPLARDAGATVDQIARALGISRPGVYALMERGKKVNTKGNTE